jgi:hypothetical protein
MFAPGAAVLLVACGPAKILGRRTDSPERRAFGETFPGGQPFLPQRRQALKVIKCKALAEHRQAKEGSKLRNGLNAVLACWIKKRPPPHMLFRPEEIHLASGSCYILAPTQVRNVGVANRARRIH